MTISINWSRKFNFQKSPVSSMGSRVFVMNFPLRGTWKLRVKTPVLNKTGHFEKMRKWEIRKSTYLWACADLLTSTQKRVCGRSTPRTTIRQFWVLRSSHWGQHVLATVWKNHDVLKTHILVPRGREHFWSTTSPRRGSSPIWLGVTYLILQ